MALAVKMVAGWEDGGYAHIWEVFVLVDHVPYVTQGAAGILIDRSLHTGGDGLSLPGSLFLEAHHIFAVIRPFPVL